jgi:hypothetical protein
MAEIQINRGCLTQGDSCFGEGERYPVNTHDDDFCCGKVNETGDGDDSNVDVRELGADVVRGDGGDDISIGCKDPEASNYDADADENCEKFSCCKYEDQSRDPIDCGNAVKQSKLEVEINTINGEIQVLQNQRTQITDEQNNGFIPNTNSGYGSYLPYSNLNADIQVANTNEIFEEQTNEAVYRRYTSLNIEGVVETDFNSFGGDPDFSDSTKWIPEVDTNGVVSFVLNDVYNDDGDDTLTLSHNSQENAGANLYKEFCIAKGYTFDFFYMDKETGTQIPFTPDANNTYQPQGDITQKCVDTNYITCAEVANVKMVFAANEWSGFYLPKDDGDTDVEISMDVMVKFNADTLLNECTEGDTCGLPYVDVNSKYDTACQNYVVFVDNQETINKLTQTKNAAFSLDSETSQGKWIYNSESITLWQTPGLQNEPNEECCKAFGGAVVDSDQYLSNGNTLNFEVIDIEQTSEVNTDRQKYLDIEKRYEEILNEVNSCDDVQYPEYEYRGCESNYAELITTNKICSITPPDDCLAYTTLLQDYEVMINQLALVDDSLTICVNEYNFLKQEIEDIDGEIVIKKSERAAKEDELQKTQTSHELESALCGKVLENLRVEKKGKEDELSNEKSKDNPNSQTINSLQTEINDLDRQIEDKELECFQITRNHTITIENIKSDIKELDKCINDLNDYKEKLKESRNSKECCVSLQSEVNEFEIYVKGSEYTDVLSKTNDCYDNWKDTLQVTYNELQETQSGNVLNFMENTTINVSLEVDNSIGQQENNRVTKYNTLPSYTSALNPVWKFDPTGGYTGVLLEGSDSSINIVKDSVNSQLISNGGSGNNKIFEPQWQKIKFTLNEQQCNQLRLCYPDKQFFIGLSIVNENNCETTLLVDNIQINTDVNEITRVYSANNCPSFDLSCVIDDKKSWVFSDGGVTTKYIVSNNSCNPSPTDEKILTFSKPQERYRDTLEYRYTDYSVNHSKLVLNSKETSFRIDPANAIECDVYNFWQEIDCDNCNTLFSCATATTLTYTNPNGGTLPLSGASCSSFDCDDILSDIKYGYSTWLDRLDSELNDSTLIRNMSFSVMNNTKNKPKGSQRVSNESYVNDLFNTQNINKYDVSYFLPKSLGVGFDIQKSNCNSDIIEIKKYNEDVYTLISEETDGTLGFYSYTADTNDICELTSLVDEECCNRVSDYLNDTFKINKPNYGWEDGACRWKESVSIEDNCDNDCSYYGTILKQSNVIIPGITTSGTTTLEEKFGLDSSTDIYVFYDATSNSLSNIRIQSAHIYRWWVHYIQGGVLVDIPEGETYTGKLRQYAVVGKNSSGARDPQGERWLAWASYPWTGSFLSTASGDSVTNHGLLWKKESNDDENCDGGFPRKDWQYGGDANDNRWSDWYDKVSIWDDETVSDPTEEVKSVLEILYDKVGENQWKDPITEDIYNEDDPYLIKQIPGVHRSDDPVIVNGKSYTTGGIAPELKKYMDPVSGVFDSLPADYQLTGKTEFNRERVFMISMIDEAEKFYHPTDTNDGQDLDGDPSHDFYISGSDNATSGFTQSYVEDFNKFIEIYRKNYTYFRGYNYSTLGGLKSSWPSQNDLTRCRALFALHSYAAIQGEVVAPIDFEEYIYSSSGGTLTSIQSANPYSALTATTLDGQNKAGLKHFGWAENHQVGLGNKFTPLQIPQDVSGLTENDPVLQYTIGPSGTTAPSLSATCTDVPICINPLDYLDKEPNEVNIKPNFDEMVLSNLIDVKSRQVISDYPMLRLFYNQYLNANGCGASITNRLDYNTTFEVMDLIGDYWTDIIEQVVPATTIWDGCQNSGKVYRNTIFDQNKYNYRRYAINYYNGECGINEITRESIAVNSVSKIDLTESCLSGKCLGEDMNALNSEIKSLEIRAKFLDEEINKITKILEQNAK